jgi:imidazole glycerol-phosphate synthase subunit HisH
LVAIKQTELDMKVAIIDYNAGNVRSVIFALKRLGIEPILTHNHEEILGADKVIFPGQGEASSAMKHLKQRGLEALIPKLKQPFLGICIGMQLLCEHSEENDTECLGVIPHRVVKFESKGLKVPQVGWNTLKIVQSDSVLPASLTNDYVYFVHSYYVEVGEYTTATCGYGDDFSAAIRKDNFHATQFHPEKSGAAGELILKTFIEKM